MLSASQWTKVVTDPLGIAGFALSLVFGVVSRVLSKKQKKGAQWLVPAAFVLAVICVFGGLLLACRHEAPPMAVAVPPVATPPVNSMHIDKIDQNVSNGSAIAGVQGSITVPPPEPPKNPNPSK